MIQSGALGKRVQSKPTRIFRRICSVFYEFSSKTEDHASALHAKREGAHDAAAFGITLAKPALEE